MKEIRNLTYKLEIVYKNMSGLETVILFQIDDKEFKIKSVKEGDVSFTNTSLKGYVHSASFVRGDKHGGWERDPKNGEFVPVPKDSPMSVIEAKGEIEKIKWSLTEDFVLIPILKNDYNIVALDRGEIKLTKTASAENENFERYSVQEIINLSKSQRGESFVETYKKRVYKIGDKCVDEENQTLEDSDIKSQLDELSYIISQHPQNCTELIELKNKIQQKYSINEGKTV